MLASAHLSMVIRYLLLAPYRPLFAVFLAVLGVVAAPPGPVSGQAPHASFQNLSQRDGLSMDSVQAILQDRAGFIWIGTQDGLDRWDGETLKVFGSAGPEDRSLSSSFVQCLAEDGQGRIWIGTNGFGLDRYDPETGRFHHYSSNSEDRSSLSDNVIQSLLVDPAGHILVGTASGLDRLDPKSGLVARFRPIDTAAGFETGGALTLHRDGQGRTWAGSRQGLLKLDVEAATFEPVGKSGDAPNSDAADGTAANTVGAPTGGSTTGAPTGGSTPGTDGLIRDIADHPAGGLWLVGPGALLHYRPSSGVVRRYRHDPKNPHSLGRGELRSVLVDSDSRTWVSGGPGLFLLHEPVGGSGNGEARFQRFANDPSDPSSLANDNVATSYMDHAGRIWVGTVSGGVDRFDPRTWSFGHFRGSAGAQHGFEESNVFAFTESPDGDLWVGTFGGGLYRWRRDEGYFESYRHSSGDPSSLSSDSVSSLLVDRRGRLFVGTYDAGLQVMEDLEAGTFRHFESKPGSARGPSSAKIVKLFEDGTGDIWIGTFRGGLSRLRRDDDRFEHYRSDPDDPGSLPEDRVSSLEEDSSGRLWIGTSQGGLAYFDNDANTFVGFRHDPEDRSSLPSDNVLSLHTDDLGRLWIGTQGKGLAQLPNPDRVVAGGAEFRTWTSADGLVNQTIYGIGSDDENRIWLSTNRGLIRFDTDAGTFTNYAPRHGLQGAEFNVGAYYRSPSGELFFGGTNGFNAFDPERIRISTDRPNIVLNGLSVRGGEWQLPETPLERIDSLELDHRHTAISFDVSVLDFASPQENRYRYRLDPFDPDWVESPVDRGAVYTNVEPGSYTFRAEGANSEGAWSDRELRIAIVVAPAPWETWWAYTAYIALILGLGYTGYKRRIEGLRRRGAELAELVAQRTRELSETVDRLSESENAAHVAKRRALKALEEALDERRKAQQADQAKSAFLSSMSHELRTPLNAVLGFAQLMERDQELSREHRESLGVILRSGEHLLSLINDVLSLSKIEAGRLGISLGPFDPRNLAATLREMVRVRVEEKGLELRSALDTDLPEALIGDSGRLTQILLNLLGNAIKFTDSGHVELAIGLRDDRVRFAVTDTGPGIPEDELGELFHPFAQTEIGRLSEEGTGLGLAISHELVAIMGGELTVESTVGEGTTFAFDLALERATVEAAPVSKQRIIGLEPGQLPTRILIVDDIPENRELIVRLHETVGLEVRTAADGREALEVWGSWRPHLIWMDMRMPVMDGYEATRRIRRAEAELADRRTLIIAFTATAFEHDRKKILAAGCDDVLTKPFRDEALFTKLTEHLDLRFVRAEITTEESSSAVAMPPRPRSGEARPPGPGKRRILIAEDSQANQMVAQRMLDRLGFHTEVVSNGLQALAAAEDRGPFDLIFMDIRMPEMDGLEATKALRRALPPGRQPVIVALTGLASENERQECIDAGMDDVLPKPFRLADLETTVHRWLPGDNATPVTEAEAKDDAEPDTVLLPTPTRRTEPAAELSDFRSDRAIDIAKLEQLERLDEGEGTSSLTAQVISLFVDTVPGQLEDLRGAVAARDRHRWRKVAHSLKNSSATLGADAVSEVCRELEELGRRANPTPEIYAEADRVANRLTNEVRRALRALEALRHR